MVFMGHQAWMRGAAVQHADDFPPSLCLSLSLSPAPSPSLSFFANGQSTTTATTPVTTTGTGTSADLLTLLCATNNYFDPPLAQLLARNGNTPRGTLIV